MENQKCKDGRPSFNINLKIINMKDIYMYL